MSRAKRESRTLDPAPLGDRSSRVGWLDQLLAQYTYLKRGLDPDLNLIAAHLADFAHDTVTDQDSFGSLAGEYKHGALFAL